MDVRTTTRPMLPQGRWRLDTGRSNVGFAVRKLGFGTVRGRFAAATVSIAVRGEKTAAGGSVRVASIDTGNAERDVQLCGFFAAAEYPEMTFTARRIEEEGDAWKVAGELTIRDVTRPLELTVERTEPRHLRVRGELDRRDFGLTWSLVVERTGVVSNHVHLELDLVLAKRSA